MDKLSLYLLAQGSNPFGQITQPKSLTNLDEKTLPARLVTSLVQGLVIFAAFYAFINLLLAGYDFISAGDDPKKVASAWGKIYQTILGLVVSAGAFVLAAIFGQLIFGNKLFLLQPSIPQL